MTRLHSRIYLHMLAVLLVVGLATSLVFSLGQRGLVLREVTQRLARYLASELGDRPLLTKSGDAERARLRHVITQLHHNFEIDLSVCDLQGVPLASAGRPLPPPADDELLALQRGQDIYQRRAAAAAAPIREPATGTLIAILQMSPPRRLSTSGVTWLWRPFLGVALVLLLVAVASRPLARRITRPIDLLTEASRRLGQGELSYRIPLPAECAHAPPPWHTPRSVGKASPQSRPLPPMPPGGPFCRHTPRWGSSPLHHHHRDELFQLMQAWNDMADHIERLLLGQRELLANVSHELRSPLARVRLALELLPRDAASEARIGEIEADLGELDRLIEDVLITSRLQATGLPTHPASIALRPLLAQVIERTRSHPHTAGKDVRLKLADQDADLTLFADANLLKRAVLNLIENAGKYGAPPIVVSARRAAGFVEIAVMDEGEGIPESERERVLEPFYRADKAHTPSPSGAHRGDKQGFGLGLTLARRVAEAHGGHISVTAAHEEGASNQPERGCCVTLYLPEDPREEARDAEGRPATRPGNRRA